MLRLRNPAAICVFLLLGLVVQAGSSIGDTFIRDRASTSAMRTALLTLIYKVQMEEQLEPPTTYSSRLLKALLERHPDLQTTAYNNGFNTGNYIVHRSLALDGLLNKVLKAAETPTTLVMLSSGFDARSIRYRQHFHQVFEVDPPVISREKQAVYSQLELAQDHTFIPGDITRSEWIENLPRENVIFILEGVLPYLDEEQARTVLLNLATHFRHSHIIVETLPEYMVPTARLSLREAFMRWLLSRREDLHKTTVSYRSGGSFLTSGTLFERAECLPTGRIEYKEHINPVHNSRSWKLKVPGLLGLDTPRITWLSIH